MIYDKMDLMLGLMQTLSEKNGQMENQTPISNMLSKAGATNKVSGMYANSKGSKTGAYAYLNTKAQISLHIHVMHARTDHFTSRFYSNHTSVSK